MNTRPRQQQGYALLIMMIGLLGLGGTLAASFTEDAKEAAKQARFDHNERVLKEAKQALLMYAYNYPTNFAGRGPGRLPCPDIDNDGSPDTSPNCGGFATPDVGRLPFAAAGLDFYDIRDASGERLWYAVSGNFDHGDDDVVNAGSDGTITLHDGSGLLLFDGAANNEPFVSEGIAAVIIAPGAVIDRNGVAQDRSIANSDNKFDTTADTDPGILDPTRYLDIIFGRDNADFVNADSANGFVRGPIFSPAGAPVVNDQFIIITAEEVTQMAQRAVLEEYNAQISDWQALVPWGAAPVAYPWLNDYDDIVNLDIYHVTANATIDTVGRLPYMNYFVDGDTHRLVTDLVIDYDLNGVNDFNLTYTGTGDGTLIGANSDDLFDGFFNGVKSLDITDANLFFEQENFDDSVDQATDNAATMVVQDDIVNTVINAGASQTRRFYFWDGCASCFDPNQDGWELCNAPASSVGDCARANGAPYNYIAFTSDWNNHADIRIRFIEVELVLDADFELGFIPTAVVNNNGSITPPTGTPTFLNARRPSNMLPGLTDFVVDDGADAATAAVEFARFDLKCEQDNFVGGNYNVFELGNDDSESYDCTPDFLLTLNSTPGFLQFDVTMDYLPVFLRYVREEGRP